MRLFKEESLLIASHNKGKITEFGELFVPYEVSIASALDFSFPIPEETGCLFTENALIKARYYGRNTHLPTLSDDSGLSIDALDGRPGVYSADWSGEQRDFSIATARIKRELCAQDSIPYRAHFTCVLALWWPDEEYIFVEGKTSGYVRFPAKGKNGFGYDAIFIPDGSKATFGEMSAIEKRKFSPRTLAFEQLTSLFTKKIPHGT